jgi:hypothetical protein
LLGTIAVKLTALPAVMYSMNPLPQPLVDPAWTPKFNVSAAAGWVVVSVVVAFAGPVIDPEPSNVPVMPPWRQNQEPEQEAPVHLRVRATFPGGGGGAGFAWAGTTASADIEAAMRTPKVRIKSLTGANRRERVERI